MIPDELYLVPKVSKKLLRVLFLTTHVLLIDSDLKQLVFWIKGITQQKPVLVKVDSLFLEIEVVVLDKRDAEVKLKHLVDLIDAHVLHGLQSLGLNKDLDDLLGLLFQPGDVPLAENNVQWDLIGPRHPFLEVPAAVQAFLSEDRF